MNREELINAVENAKQGNRQAFEKLYSAYYQKVYCFVLKNVGKKEAAEDITQDTFLRSMEKIGGLENPEHYSTWLHSIAYNSCTDMFRSQRRNTYFESDEEMEMALDNTDLNEPIMVPEDYMINRDRADQLRAMIDQLKPDVRSAMIMYYYDDMNVAQVANALGMKENLAKQKLFRGRQKLKDKIEKLQQQGILLCAMPVGDLMKNTVTTKQAAACRAAYGATAHGTMFMGKVIGVSAAAVLAVSVPLILHKAHNTGIVTDDSSAVHREDISDLSTAESKSDDTSSEAEKTESAAPAAVNADSSAAEAAASSSQDESSDVSSAVEEKKSVREENLKAIDGSHVFSAKSVSKTFDELYKEGCANASATVDGRAMAVIHTDSAAGSSYYTVFFTQDYGKNWEQATKEMRMTNGTNQFFALDNGDILQFRTSGADYRAMPFISFISQQEALVPDQSSSLSIKNEYGNPEEPNTVYYTADYKGGNTLYISAYKSEDDSLLGTFTTDINNSYNFVSFTMSDEETHNADINDSSTADESSKPEDSSTAEKKETVPVEMSVNKLLSTDVDTLLEMSNNDYEFVLVQGQSESYGFKCAAFPNYIFRVDQEYKDGAASGPFDVPANADPDSKHIEVNGKTIRQIDLVEGAQLGNGITVGMSYNEIKEIMGGELKVHINNSSLEFSADVDIDGRTWMLHFDLTNEQKDEVRKRINDEIPDPENADNTQLWGTFVDISDMDPKCDMAVSFIR